MKTIHKLLPLILRLQDMLIPDTANLVSLDVESLYPSIHQTECLKIVHEEMLKKHILPYKHKFQLFRICQRIFSTDHRGTAMGMAFSPTVTTIFMSVTFRSFLETQKEQPLLLVRYIDDILIIWPDKNPINHFLAAMNSFHPTPYPIPVSTSWI